MTPLSRRTILSTAGLGLLALASGPGQAARPRALVYTVARDGDAIGEHAIRFSPTATGQEVTFATDIAVRVAFITAFRFTHEATEVWTGDRLATLTSTTNDDGTRHAVRAIATGDALEVTADGKSTTLPADTLVHDHWNPANTTRSRLLSIYDGGVLDVAFAGPVEETVTVGGQALAARRFDASGGLTRSFWFDGDDRLVKVAFDSRGSAITYDLRP